MKRNLTFSLIGTLSILSISCSQESSNAAFDVVSPTVETTRPEEAFPDQRGVVASAYLNGQLISYQLIQNQAVFENDILLFPDNLQERNDVKMEGTGRTKASSRWPNKIVYYTIDPALPKQARVRDAIAHWQTNTSIRFVERTTQRGYVLFKAGSGCSSNVGYSGGQQYIILADGCSTGNTIHEIGHTIGLWHEHSRADRDTYITVNTGNIITGYESEFQTYTQRGLDGFDYSGGLDFGSIMLYGSYDLSKNGLPTLTRKNGTTFSSQRNGLSATDINTVRYMYP